jgi:hypothetical protein
MGWGVGDRMARGRGGEAGSVQRTRLAATALAVLCSFAPSGAAASPPLPGHAVQRAGDDAADLVRWVVRSRDHGGRPFAIVDKRKARIHVFDGDARLRGSSPVLLGQAVGDDIAPNVGMNTQAGFVPFHERTTPAGRFVSEPGRNDKGEHVVWVDYDSAFAIHRLRPGRGSAARAQRLASPSTADKRASLGCVVVPVAFYLDIVQRFLGERRSVVYVMPETGSLADIFASM